MKVNPLPTSLAAAAALLLQSAEAQVSSPNCNNKARDAQITAGFHNSQSESCATFSISVAGLTFSTPSTCVVGDAFYHGTIYGCADSTTLGSHCTAAGYKVNITLRSGGGCPSVVGLDPGSWESWEDVPSAVVDALTCIAPSTTTTFDYSASVKRCEPPELESPTLGLEISSSGVSFERFAGDPAQFVDDGALLPFDPAQIAWAMARDLESTAPAPIAAIADRIALHDAVDVQATITIRHLLAGSATHQRSFELEGRFWRNGQIDTDQFEVVEFEGESLTARRRLRLIGGSLAIEADGEAGGDLWTASSTEFERARLTFVEDLDIVRVWVDDPFQMPLFEGSHFDVTASSAGLATVERRIDSSGPVVWRMQAALEPFVAPSIVEILDSLGRVRRSTTFGDEQVFGDGLQRPATMTCRRFVDGTAEGRVIETELVVHRAHGASPTDTVPLETGLWRIWH